MTDGNELRRHLDRACDDQRDLFLAAIDAAYKLGLTKGRDEKSQQDQEDHEDHEIEFPDHLRLVMVKINGKGKIMTLEQFKKHQQEDNS